LRRQFNAIKPGEFPWILSGGRVVVDRWFPSSKTGHACGALADAMPLNIRQWTCVHCGA
jgi:putative transposase